MAYPALAHGAVRADFVRLVDLGIFPRAREYAEEYGGATCSPYQLHLAQDFWQTEKVSSRESRAARAKITER